MNDRDRDVMLGEIHANVLTMKDLLQAHEGRDQAIHGDVEARLRVLEATGQSQKGAVSAVVAVISALWAVATVVFEHYKGH